MLALLLAITMTVLGLGWPFNRLIRWLLPSLDRYAGAISVTTLVTLVTVSWAMVEYPTWPRHLRLWQREALTLNCPTAAPTVGRITFYVCTAEGELEAQDYSREFMDVLSAHNLSISYGCDPAWNHIVVNKSTIIAAPDNDVFLRVYGIELWVLDPAHPSLAATQMADALAAAGFLASWKPDLRLAGTEVYDRNRFPVNGPQCVIVIGSKPPWSWYVFCHMERQFLRFRSKHPPDARWVMYQAVIIYAFLIFCAPLAVFVLRFWTNPASGVPAADDVSEA
jgi:hypothetical protein